LLFLGLKEALMALLANWRRSGRGHTFQRSPAGGRDHDKLNLNRLSANCCDIRCHHHEPSLLKAGDQVMSKAIGQASRSWRCREEHRQAFAVRVRPLSLWFLPQLNYQGNHGERMDSELLMARTAYLFELIYS
jgi:hypothetical protein